MGQGKLIVFEGGEGAGKTTQLQRSRDWLLTSDLFQVLKDQGELSQVIVTREPGGTALGQHLRQVLLHHPGDDPLDDRAELLLYAADRAQHVEEVLRPHLQAGALILCDRYTDSTVAYQGYGRGLDLPLIHHLNEIATQGLQSDLTLWLDLDPAMGLARTQQRGIADRMEQANLAFHGRVRQGFETLAAEHSQRIHRIDASLTEESVAQRIQTLLAQRLTEWYPVLLHR